MAAAISKATTLWHDQDAASSLEQSAPKTTYARPAVTTGASLPWGKQSMQSLGQPRAFHAGASSVSTITIASKSQAVLDFNAVQKSEASESTVPASPFAEIIAPEMKAGSFSLEIKEGIALSSQELDPAHVKQGSLQSTSSHFTVEPPIRLSAGHLITTAQDHQGMATTSAIRNSGGGAHILLSSQRSFPSSSPRRHQSTVITTAQPNVVPGPAIIAPVDEEEEVDHVLQPRQSLPLDSDPGEEAWQAEECQHMANSSGLQDAIVAATEDHPNHVEQRRLRRRNNNRESAKRVREKRDADLKAVCDKVVRLEEYQAQLLKHCSAMDNDCHHVRQKLQKLQSRWEDSEAENMRLKFEVEHLRKNVEVGEQGMMGIKSGSEDLLVNEVPDLKLGEDLPNFEWEKTFEQLADASSEDWRWL